MSKQPIRTDQAPQPSGAYSQGLRIGNTIWTAGQGPWDPVTRQVVGTTIEEQAIRALENIKAILEAGGATMADVVKATVYLADMSLFPRFNEIYARYFADPKPVRTTVHSQLSSILILIDVVACIGDR